MSIPIRVQFERDHAMTDVSDIVNEYGEDVYLYVRGETNITRDKYNSIRCESYDEGIKYTLKSKPVNHNPNLHAMEKAGLREDCQAVMWVSMKDILSMGLTFDTFEIEKMTVIIDGNNYGIKEKSKMSGFADQHLYITLGLFKK